MLAIVEIDFEKEGTRLCEGRDGCVCDVLEATELNATEKRTICGKGEDTDVGDVFAAAKVYALETPGGSGETGDDGVGRFGNASEVDCDQIWQGRKDARKGVIGDGVAVDKGETFEPIALGEATEEGVGEVGA